MDSNQQKVYPPLDNQQGQGFQNQQPGFYPQQPQNAPPMYNPNPPLQTTVITQQPSTTVVIQSPHLGPNPQNMQCPGCRATIMTSVKYEPATKTHIFAGLICLVGCWLGCCLIPYCVDSCQNANHSCPNCGTFLGSHT